MTIPEVISIEISSCAVAELFTRQHGKVLRTIRGVECDKKFFDQNFKETTYQDRVGRKFPMFMITRAGFNFLIMHFTGKKARQIRAELVTNTEAFFCQQQSKMFGQSSSSSSQSSPHNF